MVHGSIKGRSIAIVSSDKAADSFLVIVLTSLPCPHHIAVKVVFNIASGFNLSLDILDNSRMAVQRSHISFNSGTSHSSVVKNSLAMKSGEASQFKFIGYSDVRARLGLKAAA